ncbi:hypothetical protein LPJ66_003099 [Kickxella alabastrina]|uniref:Uncharacterized protein n=1 Tax=Kickxella alabastrina TaxID=61397 RepID=A0ACC1IL19_9FUNG|nr:hypothetical protein LPJ66_003099 [Kickxella alabastrina]
MVNAVRAENSVIPPGRTPIPDCRLKLKDHQSDIIPGTPHKPDIAFYHPYKIQDIYAVHAILEAKMDPNPNRTPEDTRGQLADYGHMLNDKQATRTFAPVFYLHGRLLTLHAYYRDKLYIVELGDICFDTDIWTSDGAERIQECLMQFWFLLTLESKFFGHFCNVSKKSDSFFFSQKVDNNDKGKGKGKGSLKIEVLYSVSMDDKDDEDVMDDEDVKDGAALFCIKETIARYSYMIGRHVHLFRGKFNGKHDAVLKLSWTPVNRLPEGAAYAILNKRPVECIPKIFSSGLLISDLNGYRLEFVLMEYCGKSMAEYLKVKTDKQKVELVPGFAKQLTLCLAQAYDSGVLHRDISAGNVCVKNDKVYVIDWGCAKVIGWGTAEDAARDATPTQPNQIDVAKQWGFNATTVGQVEVDKDPFTGTPLFMGIPMLSSSPIRGILDDLESVFYVVLDAVRPAGTKRDDVQGFKFLDSQSLALSRYSIMMVEEKYLELFGIGNPGKVFRDLFHSMRQFLFEPGDQYISHHLWWDSTFKRQANWDAAPRFMHPKAIELLGEDNGQLKRPAEDEVNAGSLKKLAL